jgi:hypothetical protein
MSSTAIENLDSAQHPLSTTGYNVDLIFGRSKNKSTNLQVPIDDKIISDFTITLDINYLLPMFNIKINDGLNFLSHKSPPDRDALTLNVTLGSVWNTTPGDVISFNFLGLRSSPDSTKKYHVTGVLNTPNFFNPVKCRSFSGNISTTLSTMASEMGLKNNEISGSLNYPKKILQPLITNGQLLDWLKSYLEGKNSESGYYTYIKPNLNSSSLVFKPINEFLDSKPKYILATIPSAVVNEKKEAILPILDYKAVGNYGIHRVTGGRTQACGYFDFETGKYKIVESKLKENSNIKQDVSSLANYYDLDVEDKDTSASFDFTSNRTSEISNNFVYKTSGYLSKKMLNLSKLWVTTWGTHNVYPGDIIDIASLDPISPSEMYQGRFVGKWMIERVVHTFDIWHRTKFLLTRSGSNVDINTTLEQVDQKNRKNRA